MIPNDESTIVEVIRDRQRAIRRELDRRLISMKVVSQDSKIGYSTLLTYFPADEAKTSAQIPGSAVFALAGAIPDDLMSLLLPTGFLVVRAPEEVDHDEMADLVSDYLQAKHAAHRADSPGGVKIVAEEDALLDEKIAKIQSAGR
ncbi:MAG: hypothetical protein JNM03_10660 [Sphingopyxis sp.]|uniref:hypothetical protein n=1 Tax=Sphingopyxis sp. TaxID=1908224 RepID=UPI001A3D4B04|nr:hypothetical protein [Sphingopyxis sp.]MBL9070439.1 hypothetical protein [Sphingopyxis sp.]